MSNSVIAVRLSRRTPGSCWQAAFTVWVDSHPRVWRRSVGTRDVVLARRIADTLELAGRGAITIEAMIQFLESITDLATRRTVVKILRAIAAATIGPPYAAL